MNALLRKFPLLQELSDSELETFGNHLHRVSLRRGDYLFREGDPGDSFFLIESGMLVAERDVSAEAGLRKDIAILPPLSSVGEMAVFDAAPRSASVRAEVVAEVWRMSRENLDRLVTQSPSTAIKLYLALFRDSSRRLRATNDELVALYELGRFIAAGRDSRQTAETIVLSVQERLGAAYALVAIYEAATNQLRVVHAVGDRAKDLVELRLPLDRGLPAQAFDERRPLLVERLLGASEPWESESMLLLPLIERSTPSGLLLLGARRDGRGYTLDDLGLTTAVANVSARILHEGLAL